MEERLGKLKSELADIRNAAVAAHLAGDTVKADCLRGKAAGMKSTLDVAERLLQEKDSRAIGELEGMDRVITVLSPLPNCH